MLNPNLIEEYVNKFYVENEQLKDLCYNRFPENKLTDNYLKHLFNDCTIPARKAMFPQIRKAIKNFKKV